MTLVGRWKPRQELRFARDALVAGLRTGWRTTGAVWRDRHGQRQVLLIDLDAVGVPVTALADQLARLIRHVGPCKAMFAAGHPAVSYRARRACLQNGIEVLTTKAQPNSADRALMRIGYRMNHEGVDVLIVVGADAIYASLPGRVRVVVFGAAAVSQQLRKRAASVEAIPVRRSRRRRPARDGNAA